MTTYPSGPRLLKGAIVAIDLATDQRSAIVFQYNPEMLSRSLQPQIVGGEQVELHITDANSSCLIVSPGSDSAKYVVMPMRL